MKSGRAPTTERTRIGGTGGSVEVRGDQDGRRDSGKNPEDPKRGLGVMALGDDDAVAGMQSHRVDRQAARDGVLQIVAGVRRVAGRSLDSRRPELGVLGGPARDRKSVV